MLAGPRRPFKAVSDQHSSRYGVTTSGRLLPHLRSRSLKGESPFVRISEGGAALSTFSIAVQYAWPIARLYSRWLATAVRCRHRAAQSPLRSHYNEATASMVSRGLVWFGTEYQRLKRHYSIVSVIMSIGCLAPGTDKHIPRMWFLGPSGALRLRTCLLASDGRTAQPRILPPHTFPFSYMVKNERISAPMSLSKKLPPGVGG